MRPHIRYLFVAVLLLVFSMATPGEQAKKSKLRPNLDPNATPIVDGFTVAEGKKTEKWPAGQEIWIQKIILERLKKEQLFKEVVDGGNPGGAQPAKPESPAASPAPLREYHLLGTIVEFAPGNRAARYAVGFGAGKTSIRVAFAVRDAAKNEDVFKTESYGSFSGTIAFVGGDKHQGTSEAAGDVADGLIRELTKKN